MKSKKIKSIIMLMVAMLIVLVATGCARTETEVGNAEADDLLVYHPEDMFVFDENDDSVIVGLTDLGKKQSVLNVPSKCKLVLGQVFVDDKNLTSVCFEGSDTEIKASELTKEDELFDPYTPGGFSGCSSLKEVQLPANLKSVPALCFMECTSLEHVDIPASVEEIGLMGFWGCSALKDIDLSANKGISIVDSAFEGCTSLVHVSLPDDVVLSYDVFYDTPFIENASEEEKQRLYDAGMPSPEELSISNDELDEILDGEFSDADYSSELDSEN